jgi:hypothetical protein
MRVLIVLLLSLGSQAYIKAAPPITVTVPGGVGPWQQSLNPAFNYGVQDNLPPVVIDSSSGLDFTSGASITLKYVSGLVADSSGPGAQFFDANGGPMTFPTNTYNGANGNLPAYYMDPNVPVYLTELVGTFANNGVIVGVPFAIGDGPKTVQVPVGANQLLLGVNDNLYGAPSPNQGDFTVTVSGCPIDENFTLAFGAATGLGQEAVLATLTSPTSSLVDFANSCGFTMFNWQQQITTLPCGTGPRANPGAVLDAENYCSDGSLKSPPAFYDPPDGGYVYLGSFNPFPFVYDPSQYIGDHCTVALGGCPPFPFISNGQTMSFVDIPGDPSLSGEPPSAMPSGRHIDFSTSLVGVTLDASGNPVNITTLKTWKWNTTFNGSTTGGVSQTASIYPIIPGSGTGGVTITSVNGVPLTVIPSSQMVATASGLAYSHVKQTFTGTVTITNISSSAIAAPSKGFFQILFTALPSGVTLSNADGTFNSSPYITVPTVASFMPGQSATVAVQFENSSRAPINFTPVIYSGSF